MKSVTNKAITVVAVGSLLVGCANYRPAVDHSVSKNPEAFESDLAECQEIADQFSPAASGVGGALVGAAVGAALGAALGAIAGDPASGAAFGASFAGTATGIESAANAAETEREAIRKCLRGRGHAVLE